jgi:hypothetical protein
MLWRGSAAIDFSPGLCSPHIDDVRAPGSVGEGPGGEDVGEPGLEHLTEPAAAAMGHHLLQSEGGPAVIRRFIEDNIRNAVGAGRDAHAQLAKTLETFLEQHLSRR